MTTNTFTQASGIMVDFDNRISSKQQWVCPSDRQLALRAKLQTGWSVKSHAMESYNGRQESVPLDKTEREAILAVIRRAEVIDHMEQERVGKLKERLDNMKRNAVGTGINQCVLCGAQCILFGMLGTSSILCQDCKKAVCQKCGVETASSTRKESMWRCKICAETREMWKKSGAWFFKAFPKHILPSKKTLPQENKYLGIRRSGYESNVGPMKTPDFEEESSSEEERASRMLASRIKTPGQLKSINRNSHQTSTWHNSMSSSYERKSPGAPSSSFGPPVDESLYNLDNKKPGYPWRSGRSSSSSEDAQSSLLFTTPVKMSSSIHSPQSTTLSSIFTKSNETIMTEFTSSQLSTADSSRKSQHSVKYEITENLDATTSTLLSKPFHCHRAQSLSDSQHCSKISLPHAHSSVSYIGDQVATTLGSENSTHQSSFNNSFRDSQLSLVTSHDWCSESDRGSVSSSSISGYRSVAGAADDSLDEMVEPISDGSMGTLEISLLYDSMASSIHVSLQRAKNLKPMDINGLADPFCKLNLLPPGTKSHRLRTRTVHKTRNPEFNEVLTFYGVTDNDMTTRALHIIVLDDDKYGHDFMGEARYPLDRLRPDIARQLNFYLEKHYPVENEEFVWGEESLSHGQILITLCFSTKRRALLVGIARCSNLTPMDNNGYSDPFVKLYLKPDPYHKKYKTSVKWKNLNPIFNEEFVFETKMTDLPQQTLVVTVWDKDYGKSNDYLGCLELGCTSKGERLHHWVDMIKFPDHKHEGWHSLCDDFPPP